MGGASPFPGSAQEDIRGAAQWQQQQQQQQRRDTRQRERERGGPEEQKDTQLDSKQTPPLPCHFPSCVRSEASKRDAVPRPGLEVTGSELGEDGGRMEEDGGGRRQKQQRLVEKVCHLKSHFRDVTLPPNGGLRDALEQREKLLPLRKLKRV